MPRKAFLSHLRELSEETHIDGISHIERGEDDGHVLFDVRSAADDDSYRVTAIVSDVSDYPSSHYYFLSAQDDAPKAFASTLERLSNTEVGQSLPDLLQSLSNKLATDAEGDTTLPDSQFEDDDFDGFSDDNDQSMDDFDDDVFGATTKAAPEPGNLGIPESTPSQRARIRADLLKTKSAGFKVGAHGGLLDGLSCFVSLSCRMSKLGISEEAMQAWEVRPGDYLILLINYQNGYRPLHEITDVDSVQARRDVRFAVGISSTYKPTHQEAVGAFHSETQKAKEDDAAISESQTKGFRNCFISRPLNELLNERLIKLLAYREMGMPWNGAERFYNDNQGKQLAKNDALADEYFAKEWLNSTYPSLVNDDHFRTTTPQERAFPLVAMQFLLRHFVRCNEFCLVCHCKTDDDLGAIKPYVCDKPLCLYQYMSLGFGPSIEHEILTQPHVVDLLVSFCYEQARIGGKLAVFPTGLGLLVPPKEALPAMQQAPYIYESPRTPVPDTTGRPLLVDGAPSPPVEHTAKFNLEKAELLFESDQRCPVRVGDWIVIQRSQHVLQHQHCWVASTTYFPTIHLSNPIAVRDPTKINDDPIPNAEPSTDSLIFHAVKFYIYEQNFDHLSDNLKREVICQLLDILPSVSDLRTYIKTTRKELSTWVSRLSPALTSLLRWIIASCRSCIFQVDNLDDPEASKSDTRLHGMPGWMQFRFAMGAPDKERRFVSAVSTTAARLNQAYPTIFAWHGSPLHNWHSIIREGLHYNYVASGRAFGDGVYHSMAFGTSAGYSRHYGGNYSSNPGTIAWQPSGWPQSRLGITSAMALSEIVNAPAEFKSSTPHLVVQHLDWIQTRYLFVRCSNPDIKLDDGPEPPARIHKQDDAYTPQGCLNTQLIIPMNAVSRSRRVQHQTSVSRFAKLLKTNAGTAVSPIALDDFDDTASVNTLHEDLEILVEEEAPTALWKGFNDTRTGSAPDTRSMTDFVPGQLDISSLPVLPPPSYASSLGTKRLLGDFKAMVKTQNTQPLHELGWYLNHDPDLMTNLYQWIVELHTFNPTLQLAKDLKKRDMTSVVLEIRFGKDFPISPPFVRVIRPRFLGFQQGGGGHVTLGGAICMELLTNNGWTAACTIESVLLQVKMAMESTDPRPARLVPGAGTDYGIGEAVEAFERACRTHGWTIPAGLRETTQDQGEASRSTATY